MPRGVDACVRIFGAFPRGRGNIATGTEDWIPAFAGMTRWVGITVAGIAPALTNGEWGRSLSICLAPRDGRLAKRLLPIATATGRCRCRIPLRPLGVGRGTCLECPFEAGVAVAGRVAGNIEPLPALACRPVDAGLHADCIQALLTRPETDNAGRFAPVIVAIGLPIKDAAHAGQAQRRLRRAVEGRHHRRHRYPGHA